MCVILLLTMILIRMYKNSILTYTNQYVYVYTYIYIYARNNNDNDSSAVPTRPRQATSSDWKMSRSQPAVHLLRCFVGCLMLSHVYIVYIYIYTYHLYIHIYHIYTYIQKSLLFDDR